MSASDTPRTDATVKQYDGSWFALGGPAGDLLVLCRELERELAAMTKEREYAETAIRKIKMGRELRKVPPNWEHPKVEYPNYQSGRMEERYQPLYDRPFAPAMREWFTKWESWESGERPDYCPNDYEGQYWDWEGPPPDPKYYRPDWKPEEMTWFQVYETVSEGTPVTPPFATRGELVDYLVKNGDFWGQKSGDRWTSKEAQLFMEDGYAPSMVVIDGHAMSGVQAAVELNAGKQKDGK